MDPVSMAFYALVCGVLGVVLPPSLSRIVRFAVGAGVGIAAAATLPVVRALIGG